MMTYTFYYPDGRSHTFHDVLNTTWFNDNAVKLDFADGVSVVVLPRWEFCKSVPNGEPPTLFQPDGKDCSCPLDDGSIPF